MARPSRIGIVHVALALFALALIGRAAQVQLWQGRAWAMRAARQQTTAAEVPAPRGGILDASGGVLAESRELVALDVAPREVKDAAALRRALARAGVPGATATRATDRRRAWVPIPGHYLPTEAAPLVAMRGVYARPVSDRVYAFPRGLRPVIGSVAADGSPVDGLELALDSLLRGTPGRALALRDARGRRFESPTVSGVDPRPGHTVVLTINRELQEICERALASAVRDLDADGGDVLVVDPHDGALLAMASWRAARGGSATALTEPFEPGSTLKPVIAASLLTLGRARPDEAIDTYDGVYTTHGRTINDIHKAARLSLADVIGYSSNVGIVRFAERLTPREQFEALRDFGFGAPTGVPHPSEAAGRLRAPGDWSAQSGASLAMGYEVAVTPLQLALAYAAFANGGELLAPALIREIRDPDGEVLYRHAPRVVRRVMSRDVATAVREMLAGVVARGTARQAEMTTFAVAGKSGTSRRAALGRGYVAGEYFASFVGLFPADAPQYVVLVKLDNPSGKYYGGQTAAPVTKVVLEAALAARDAALDRGALLARAERRAAAQPPPVPSPEPVADSAPEPVRTPAPEP
ncbi:MAG TPA: penicillin-binding protein 2, partial [Gemmatimonadaceae bacterium]|nr:penicillin-binding protein 2 [Gemmatimonadaceae bacterium]